MPYTDVHGAHAVYSNTYSIGVNFLGNSDAPETAPTTPQLQKCAEFLAWWFDYKGYDPLSSASILNQAGTEWITEPLICGHRDVNPGGTTCPGDALYALLPDIRTSTNQIIIDCSSPSDTEAPTTSISTDRNWYNSEFEVMFSDADNAGGTGVKYSFHQIMDYDGTEWRANSDNGFFNDNFTSAIHSEWTQLDGTWSINSEHLLQSDETTSNSNIYASVSQEAGNTYLYHWQQKLSGSGANRRSGMHVFCSDPTDSGRGDSYMIYLRVDKNTVQIYEYDDGSYANPDGWLITEDFTIDVDTWYDVKLIINTNTGIIDLYIDDVLAASATDITPLTTGIAISPRTGDCQTEYDDIKVYTHRNNTIDVLPVISTEADIRYQSPSTTEEAGRIRTILIDNADNWSESVSKNIFTDFDAPSTSINVSGSWQTDDFTSNFTDTDDLSGIEKSLYCVSDFNGSKWTANMENGFAYNSFDSEIGTEWTSQVGTWTQSSGKLVQTDETEGNTNLYAYLQQDLSNRYLYEFDLTIDGTDANKRGGFHYFSDDPTLTNRGNGYFVWFRWSSQELEFYKVTDDVFSLEKYYDIELIAGQSYNIKVIYDRITGDTFVYMDDILVGEYKDSEPYNTGNYVSFRSGNSNMSIDNFKVYRSRYPDATITLSETTDDIRYESVSPGNDAAMIYSIVHDSAKNISATTTIGVKVDWTGPITSGSVYDGSSTDIDITYELGEISGNLDAFTDANSSVVAYHYAVGTSPGATDLIDWTDNALSQSFTNSSVTLIAGNTYYLSVKAENGAGLFSDIEVSDGLLAEGITCPNDTTVCFNSPDFPYEWGDPEGGSFFGAGFMGDNYFSAMVAGPGIFTEIYEYGSQTCEFFITVNDVPFVMCPEDVYLPVDDPECTITGALPIGGTYYYNETPVTSFDPSTNGIGTYTIIYEYVTPENCSDFCTFNIFVYEPLAVNCPENMSVCIDDASFTLSGATPPGGSYSGTGVSAGVFNPAVAGAGEHIITYTYDTESCNFTITVNDLPEVICPSDIDVTTDDSQFTLSGATPEGGTYYIGGNPIVDFNPSVYGEGDFEVTYLYSDECENSCTFIIHVTEIIEVTCPENFSTCLNDEPISLTGASPEGGTFIGPGVDAGVFTPENAGTGEHVITYSYDLTDCEFTITTNDVPVIICPEDITVTYQDSPFPLEGGEPEGGIYSIDGTPVSYINPPSYETGDYEILYTYTDPLTGCSESCTFNLTITPYVFINQEDLIEFDIFPNPNTGTFTVLCVDEHKDAIVELFSIEGKLIHSDILNKDIRRLDFSMPELNSGIYFIRISYEDFIKNYKLVIR
ncbi:MAG: hypothetical protein C0596_05775 [Marinilabiliales bacterium]|nr:MAG: hypothetical protein C0596_05775 [Marinilabiliales bacterium]